MDFFQVHLDSLLDFKQLLIFTDLDGTLVGHEDYDVSAALPCLQQLMEHGAQIVLNSSKTRPELLVWQRRLGLNTPFVVENGGAIYFPRQTFELSDLDKAAIDAGIVEEDGDFFVWPLGPRIATMQEALATLDDTPLNLVDCSLDQAVELTGLNPEDAAMAQDRRYTIPMLLTNDVQHSNVTRLAQDAGLRLTSGGRFNHLQGHFNKADAMDVIQKAIQLKSGNAFTTIALGDNHNDAEMLTKADIAVVVRSKNKHAVTINGRHTIYTNTAAPEGWCEGISSALSVLKEMN